jgi:hypothetical protein
MFFLYFTKYNNPPIIRPLPPIATPLFRPDFKYNIYINISVYRWCSLYMSIGIVDISHASVFE